MIAALASALIAIAGAAAIVSIVTDAAIALRAWRQLKNKDSRYD